MVCLVPAQVRVVEQRVEHRQAGLPVASACLRVPGCLDTAQPQQALGGRWRPPNCPPAHKALNGSAGFSRAYPRTGGACS